MESEASATRLKTGAMRGRDAGFEIRGLSDSLLELYSQGSRQRDEAIEAFMARNGGQRSGRPGP